MLRIDFGSPSFSGLQSAQAWWKEIFILVELITLLMYDCGLEMLQYPVLLIPRIILKIKVLQGCQDSN